MHLHNHLRYMEGFSGLPCRFVTNVVKSHAINVFNRVIVISVQRHQQHHPHKKCMSPYHPNKDQPQWTYMCTLLNICPSRKVVM